MHSDAGKLRLCCVLLRHLLSHTADSSWMQDANTAASAPVAAFDAKMVCCADCLPLHLWGCQRMIVEELYQLQVCREQLIPGTPSRAPALHALLCAG